MNQISPATINLTICNGLGIYQGAYWEIPVTVSERDKLIDTPIDLTGYTGRCTIKKCASDDEPIATPDVTITDPESGVFVISLSSNLTKNLIKRGCTHKDITTYQYDVYLDKDGESYRALQGYVEVSPSVTDESAHIEE